MSAYLVSHDTIDLIIAALQSVSENYRDRLKVDQTLRDKVDRAALDPFMDEDLIGTILWHENVRSVEHRYPQDRDNPADPAYKFTAIDAAEIGKMGDAFILTAIKSLHCLRYQSCECEDYAQTNAAKFLDQIESILVHELPGYDALPWGWERGR
jgi:hypothetical protein